MAMSETVDVVVVGSGGAGLTAALAAHDQGAQVALIEKSDKVGGTTAISGGVVWVANNPLMAAGQVADSRGAAIEYFQSLSNGDIDPAMVETFVDTGPEVIRYLMEHTPARFTPLWRYPDYFPERPGGKTTGGRSLDNDLFEFASLGPWAARIHGPSEMGPLMLRETPVGGGTGAVTAAELERRRARDARGGGQALVGALLKACLDRGIEPRLGWRAGSLIKENGRVVGIERAGAEPRSRLMARRGVILASGGFEWDPALRQTFLRGPATHPASFPGNEGDGLRLAMAAGADLGNMTSAWWVPVIAVPDAVWFDRPGRASLVLLERTRPHSIMVNRKAQRFCNEATNYSAIAGAFHAFDPGSYTHHNLPAWLIFDRQYRSRYHVATAFPGAPLPPWIIEAESLSALAPRLGLDPSALETTVATFNRYARQGRDEAFGRGDSVYDHVYGDASRPGAASTLGTLEVAPYYAVEIKMGVLGTNGGARTDVRARVLDHAGNTIPGLYAAGNVMAAPTGSVYAGAGGTLGPALTFGYIAGREAARLAN